MELNTRFDIGQQVWICTDFIHADDLSFQRTCGTIEEISINDAGVHYRVIRPDIDRYVMLNDDTNIASTENELIISVLAEYMRKTESLLDRIKKEMLKYLPSASGEPEKDNNGDD